MRRYVLPFAVAVAAALAACSGGGSVLSTGGSATNVTVSDANQSGSQLPSALYVRQGGAAGVTPLRLHAQAATGGSNNGVTNGIFTWTVSSTVTGNASGGPMNNNVSCSLLTVAPSPQPAAPATPVPAGVVLYTVPASALTVDPEDTSYATFAPPALPPAQPGFAYVNSTYCVRINATTGNATGSALVVVSP